MYKFAFTYLVKQDKKTWNDFGISLKLLYQNILKKLICSYKIIIFCEGNPSKNVRSYIDYLSKELKIKILIRKISLKDYVKRKKTDKYLRDFPSNCSCINSFSLGYRDMCKFFANDVFFDEVLNNVEYFVRMDTDSFFIYTNKNFLNQLESFNSDYGYIEKTVQNEDKSVTIGFGKCIYKFCKKNTNLISNFLNHCNEATLNPKIYYTNFEIVRLEWARSNIHRKFLAHIIRSQGIYKFRWGDALIRFYSVNLLGASKESLNGCLYKHSGIYDTRNFVRVFLTKAYSKLRNRLYSNLYEKKLSFLDKLFLGI